MYSMITNLIILFQLLLLMEHTFATTKSHWDQYMYNQDINCTQGQACTIICRTAWSCQYSRIFCPEYHTCDIQCLADRSCESADITWPLVKGFGTLSCAGSPVEKSCRGTNWPQPVPSSPLTITCDDSEMCSDSTLVCPERAACTIECIGDDSCYSTKIVWPLIETSSTLICNGWRACAYINFPDKPVSTTALSITCDGIDACAHADIYCPESASCSLYCPRWGCTLTNLYCAEGQTCNIYCTGEASCVETNMYCRSNHLCNIYCSYISSTQYSCIRTNLFAYYSGTINTDCSSTGGCTDIRYHTWTADPTQAPTNPTNYPTKHPTNNPTIDPTSDPTLDPTTNPTTMDPTDSPTLSPTTCYDLNGTYTNDGYALPIYQQISQLTFTQPIMDINKTIISIQPAQYKDEFINLTHDEIKQITCSGFGSCVGTVITIQNGTICNIECNGYLSCLDTIINIKQCDKTEIICNGDKACDTSQINIYSHNNNDQISIKCGETGSCDNVYINITKNTKVNVTCYGLNACDGLTVDASGAIAKNVYNYKHIHLEMLSFSESVMFFNGFGYEEEDASNRYITCNLQDHYIQYPTDPSLQISSELRERAENEYQGYRLPCDEVTVGCFQPNSSETSHCTMQYSFSTRNFAIPFIDPSVSCYWVPVSELVDISCAGKCASAPTNSPTPAPTLAPSAETPGPTFKPTQSPTIDPTVEPTIDPTFDPTSDPTVEPTSNPSAAPSQSPTASPTQSPTMTPTESPTGTPTRDPTQDVDKIYDTKIDIAYYCYNLTKANKEYIVYNTKLFVTKFQEIIERYYFDPDNGLYFSDFWVQVIDINGKSVVFTDQRRLASDDGDLLTLYDVDILGNSPLILAAKIECDDDNGEIIIKKSESSIFRSGVERELSRNLFNNTQELYFKVKALEGDKLYEQEKFPEPAAEESEDFAVLYVSAFIGVSGVLISISDFIFNKVPSTKVDNSKYMAPLFVALAMYDLISDINLSIQMFKNENTEIKFDNFYFILALLSVVFIVLPFISNLWYAMWITSEETIANSPSARAWFGNNLPQFILLCMACAGTYPALSLTSSRLFGIEFFNAGLLTADLFELSKIKLRSTVCMENAPQLIIQIIYSYAIGKWENATILSFIASSLSILASLAIYYAQRRANEKFITTKYFLRLEANQAINDESKSKIKCNKGRKEKLRDGLCSVFEIPKSSIEIGYVTQNDTGCKIHVQHSIFKSEMKKKQREMLRDNRSFTGYKIELTEELYVDKLIKSKWKKILGVILNHFELENDQELKYKISYQSGNDGYDDGILSSSSSKVVTLSAENRIRGTSIPLTTHNEEQKLIEMVEMKDDSDGTQFKFNNAGNEYQFESMMKSVNEIRDALTTLIKSGEGSNDNVNNIQRFASVDGKVLETQLSTSL